MNGLILHCGGSRVSLDDVRAVNTPGATNTHVPIPHGLLVDTVREALTSAGYTLQAEDHALSKEGMRYFGVLGLETAGMGGTYQWTLGLRNSHDKSFRAELVAGTRVFVCDNLAFSGAVRVMRMHTRHIFRDLEGLVNKAVGALGDFYGQNDRRYEGYKQCALNDMQAHDIMVRAILGQAMPPSRLPDVLKEWREPQHVEFEDRNAWSLFNAFTENMKALQDSSTLFNRNRALHGLFDSVSGFTPNIIEV